MAKIELIKITNVTQTTQNMSTIKCKNRFCASSGRRNESFSFVWALPIVDNFWWNILPMVSEKVLTVEKYYLLITHNAQSTGTDDKNEWARLANGECETVETDRNSERKNYLRWAVRLGLNVRSFSFQCSAHVCRGQRFSLSASTAHKMITLKPNMQVKVETVPGASTCSKL